MNEEKQTPEQAIAELRAWQIKRLLKKISDRNKEFINDLDKFFNSFDDDDNKNENKNEDDTTNL